MTKTDQGPGLSCDFSADDVRIESREACHRSFLRIDQLRLRHRLFSGGWSEEMEREVLIKNHAVAVLLFDPDRDEVVLVRQFRVGLLEEAQSPWMLELVAGLIDTEESPAEIARRETLEEAGLELSAPIQIYEYYNSPGASNERVTLFCARVDSGKAGGIHGVDAEHEDIQVVVLSVREALAAIASGELNNAMTIIGLQWLALNRERLLADWQLRR